VLAVEIDMDTQTIQAVIEGRAGVEMAEAVVRAMTDKYPISLADLWVEPDDTERGVRIMRAQESAAMSRVFDRKDQNGGLTPYYEYRDTAMSRFAPFKPEWIRTIRVIDDADPDNPDVAYNNGHLMHQCTFFIGEVNFYWRIGDRGYSAEMNSGDSCYITPFVPHSFTSRNPDRLGLIIAVTYAGQVRKAVDDFARIGADAAESLAGAGRTKDYYCAFAARLGRYLATESLTPEELSARLADDGMDRARAEALVCAEIQPTAVETAALADILHVRASDFAVTPAEALDAVTLRFARDVSSRPYPNGNAPVYRLRELARDRRQPGLKGFDITVLDNGDADGGAFRHGLHQYVYNYGDVPVSIYWGNASEKRSDVLEPGDSAYIRPMVTHAFGTTSGGSEGHLAVVRIPGALTEEVIEEFAAFAPAGRARVVGETKQWF
jgi:methylphosphonate synthase